MSRQRVGMQPDPPSAAAFCATQSEPDASHAHTIIGPGRRREEHGLILQND